MLAPWIMVIKMSKMAHFFVFSTDAGKTQLQFEENIYVHLKDLIWLFQKMLWIVGFWATISKISTLENTTSLFFCQLSSFLIFLPSISHKQQLQDQLTIPFCESNEKDLSGTLKCFAYTVTNFLLSSAKNTKNKAFIDILTLTVNMIATNMTPFFNLLFKLYQLVNFVFAFKDFQNSFPPLHFAFFCKIHIYMPKMALSSLWTWIPISNKIC